MLVAVQEDGTTTNEWLYQAFPCRDMHEQVSQLGVFSTSPLQEGFAHERNPAGTV